jgi:hypothetical protein
VAYVLDLKSDPFLGTSPPEFDGRRYVSLEVARLILGAEWLIDFDYMQVPVGDYIPRYGSGILYLHLPLDLTDEILIVHHGIKNRLFPDEATLNRTPYGKLDTLGSKSVSNSLGKKP